MLQSPLQLYNSQIERKTLTLTNRCCKSTIKNCVIVFSDRYKDIINTVNHFVGILILISKKSIITRFKCDLKYNHACLYQDIIL